MELQRRGRGGGRRGQQRRGGGNNVSGASVWQQVGQQGVPGSTPGAEMSVSAGSAPPPTRTAPAGGRLAQPESRNVAEPGGVEQRRGGVPSPAWVTRPTRGGGSGDARGTRGGSAGAWSGAGGERRVEHHAQGLVPASRSVTPDSVASGLGRLDLSSPSSAAERLVAMERPDCGGSWEPNKRLIRLRVNHFLLGFNDGMGIHHYDISVIRSENSGSGRTAGALEISKREFLAVKAELFSASPALSEVKNVATDGVRNLYSPRELPQENFDVVVSGRRYRVTLRLQKVIYLRELRQPRCPRDFFQVLDVVMRENASSGRVSVGRSFFSGYWRYNLDMGTEALKGFHQSVISTEQGPVLNVDQSVMAFRKQVNVIDYLTDICEFKFNEKTRWEGRNLSILKDSLQKLKVEVCHRDCRRRYTVFGVTDVETDMITFQDNQTGKKWRLAEYFLVTYAVEIKFKHLPCLKLSKTKENYVPMELCRLVAGQVYPRDRLLQWQEKMLRGMSTAKPADRLETILSMMNYDGPAGGDMLKEFSVSVSHEMATVTGRVLERPLLKLGDGKGRHCRFQIPKSDCQWNLLDYQVAKGKTIDVWGIADFSPSDNSRHPAFNVRGFASSLVRRCCDLGVRMNDTPTFVAKYHMNDLFNPHRLRDILGRAKEKKLQILVCPMAERNDGYKALKLIAETEVGIVTQCCLSGVIMKRGDDQYLANLCLKMNAKLGGSNFELFDGFMTPGAWNSPFMFIGADVNHPRAHDESSPSIAAVVATVNWPVSNNYISKVQAQPHHSEKIVRIGSICRELVERYSHVNGARPQRIIYFRDGVSDTQFDMVLNVELTDIKAALGELEGYCPTITVVVAQKRHQTRLFPVDNRDATRSGNVPPGTVVDRGIVAPHLFNFYLCSHNGILGTSKPTHYYVLCDEHGFTSDQMQKLTYDLCFTFNRCTKPVSLVPPVYYADILAFRGRYYYDALALSHGSSSSTASSSRNAPPPFDCSRFPEVHPSLQDAMYFV